MTTLINPEERVLSTLNEDGSRRWLEPKEQPGRYHLARRIVGYVLIAIFVTLPHLHAGGKQLFFLNIARGEFTLFGITFFRTDTLLLALALVAIFISVFLITALVGRVWCGWACPQTVYMEFVFRPLKRLFDGKKRGVLGRTVASWPAPLRKLIRYALVVLLSFFLANTFLSYFVGSRTLLGWITQPPWVHPGGFFVVAFVTVLMLLDFLFFKEQVCFVACPYGRFQSVLLDKRSLIVGYDYNRGEPRGRPGRKHNVAPPPTGLEAERAPAEDHPGDVSLPILAHKSVPEGDIPRPAAQGEGDCIDCHRCVHVCPTGIDIRDGLQLECIHCTACIDACDDILGRLGKKGLIRYSSQEALATGKRKLLRPRVVLYPALLVGVLTALITLVATRAPADIRLLRAPGLPFFNTEPGVVANPVRIRITNRTAEARTYTVDSDLVTIQGLGPILCEPGQTVSEKFTLVTETALFAGTRGHRTVQMTVRDDAGFERIVEFDLSGPVPAATPAQTPVQTPADTPAQPAAPTTPAERAALDGTSVPAEVELTHG